ncbi:hypothetical protein AB6N24_17900 [Cellulomonas sp. 179-A 4D5 NHS]|uniref:hypothetical protein n=1 Tax=Cellulomonas sp. 179-A 4D5 NHS TaxID=3142378 RepID=UPI0039A1302C
MNGERYFTAAPQGVRVYRDTHEFVTENPMRQSRGFDIPGDLAGWDVANGFLLAPDAADPTVQSEWRISVTGREIYAVLRRFPHENTYTFDGPVWLIDTVPDILDASVHSNPLRELVDPLERHRGEADSLLQAVQTIRSALGLLRSVAADPFLLLEWATTTINAR